MNNKVVVTCDRCGKQVEGIEHDSATGGFYRIKEDGKGWGRYTNPGERTVCDNCMWSDPRYQADYSWAKEGDQAIIKPNVHDMEP